MVVFTAVGVATPITMDWASIPFTPSAGTRGNENGGITRRFRFNRLS
jgi:hypothetical protein